MSAQQKLELSPRLLALADWVPQGARLADIGTDHGYLPVWLMLQGRIKAAIASDLRPGPLSRARQTCRSFGVESRIDCRLGDGLRTVAPNETETIVIAGMGGEHIAAILQDAPWTADGHHTMLLQPQSRPEVLRGFLADAGYAILRERLVLDRGHLYPMMEVSAGEMSLTPGQRYCGARLLHDPLGDRYIIQRILQLQSVVAGLNRSADPVKRAQADEQRDIITDLLSMREEWRHANCP